MHPVEETPSNWYSKQVADLDFGYNRNYELKTSVYINQKSYYLFLTLSKTNQQCPKIVMPKMYIQSQFISDFRTVFETVAIKSLIN